jgi:hypothetical protein
VTFRAFLAGIIYARNAWQAFFIGCTVPATALVFICLDWHVDISINQSLTFEPGFRTEFLIVDLLILVGGTFVVVFRRIFSRARGQTSA